MLIKQVFSFFCVFLIIGCATGPVDNSTKIKKQAELEFVLKSVKQIYNLNEEVRVELYVRNTTDQDFWILRPAVRGANILTEIRESKNKVKYDKFENTPKRRKQFVIESGSEILYSNLGYGQDYFKKRGNWTLQVVEKFTSGSGNREIKNWSGDMVSNVLELEIK